jgi:hypothetical protein
MITKKIKIGMRVKFRKERIVTLYPPFQTTAGKTYVVYMIDNNHITLLAPKEFMLKTATILSEDFWVYFEPASDQLEFDFEKA